MPWKCEVLFSVACWHKKILSQDVLESVSGKAPCGSGGRTVHVGPYDLGIWELARKKTRSIVNHSISQKLPLFDRNSVLFGRKRDHLYFSSQTTPQTPTNASMSKWHPETTEKSIDIMSIGSVSIRAKTTGGLKPMAKTRKTL